MNSAPAEARAVADRGLGRGNQRLIRKAEIDVKAHRLVDVETGCALEYTPLGFGAAAIEGEQP